MAQRIGDKQTFLLPKIKATISHSFKSLPFINTALGFRPRAPRLTFLRLHWIYFVTTCLFCSVIFWASAKPHGSVSYTDSLFLVVAAMSLAGMNSVNLSSLNTFQQAMLCCLMVFGSQIFVSFLVVHFRKRAFQEQFEKAAQEQEKRAQVSAIYSFQRQAHNFVECTSLLAMRSVCNSSVTRSVEDSASCQW